MFDEYDIEFEDVEECDLEDEYEGEVDFGSYQPQWIGHRYADDHGEAAWEMLLEGGMFAVHASFHMEAEERIAQLTRELRDE